MISRKLLSLHSSEIHYFCIMYELHHNELGKIIVKPPHPRAKHIIARKKEGYILLTIPQGCKQKNVETALQELKPKLLQISTPIPQLITEETCIETHTFTARILQSAMVSDYLLSLKNNELTLFIPAGIDIKKTDVQEKIKNRILQAVRIEAKRMLPQKTALLAKEHGTSYQQVKINSSRSRWGSCSCKKTINLSLYLLFLPEKYIRYVILHELAHTLEMSHSTRFWNILSDMCGEDAKKISSSLRKLHVESMRYFTK